MDVLTLAQTITRKNSLDWLEENTILDERLDKKILLGLILKECGALTPMYNEVNPFIMNHLLWFKLKELNIKHLCNTLDLKYDPLENYDWNELGDNEDERKLGRETEYQENTSGNKSYKSTYKGTEKGTNEKNVDTDSELSHKYGRIITDDGTTDNTRTRNLSTETEQNTTEETTVSAYNEHLYQPSNKVVGTLDSTVNETGTVVDEGKTHNTEKHTGTDTDTLDKDEKENGSYEKEFGHSITDDITDTTGNKKGDSSTDEQENKTGKYHKEVLGATGQFSKQNLLNQEREVAKWNIYEWIVKEYRKDNFYLVY